MRILLIMDPFIPVPPRFYGGIERIVADVAENFARKGHEVTLLAGPGSQSPGRLITFGREGEWTRWSNVRNFAAISAILQREARRHDVIHNFGRMLYLLSVLHHRVPKVQTYGRIITAARIRQILQLKPRRLYFTAVSNCTRRGGEQEGGRWSTVYSCVSADQYQFYEGADPCTAPLAFLGRLERLKGAHSAIAAARKAGRKLIIAGNISNDPVERTYFETEIKPHIDGTAVEYIGPVDNAGKNQLFGSAAALLLPVEWEDPFPVVLPEALLCGTPVIAFRNGGVPEGIIDGKNGFVCDTADEMAKLIGRLPEIDRKFVRADAETRFSASAVADDYLELYRRALSDE